MNPLPNHAALPGAAASVEAPFALLLRSSLEALRARPGLRARLSNWPALRSDARQRWEHLCEARRFAQEYADDALSWLLPHVNSPAVQARDGFVHPEADPRGDPLGRLICGGWLRPGEEPLLGRALVEFVRKALDEPAGLWPACDALAAAPGGRGLNAALVSPILHALQPDRFVLGSASLRGLLSALEGSDFGPTLDDYPACNAAAQRLLLANAALMRVEPYSDHHPSDLLDAMAEWALSP
ncbi:MAG: hypothetical protein ACT4PU_11850 [Planctomycetota bacterium]